MDRLDRRQGLSSEQVAQRVRDGLSNADEGIKTKTEKQIILENTFTFFNILNFVLALFVLLVGSFKNLLFLGVIFSNIIIGSFQGIRAKRTIDKLSLISAPKASVLRDGKLQTIPVSGIVMNDVLHLSTGQQICADAIVRLLGGQQPDPAPVANSACYSPITAGTASWLTAVYQYDGANRKMVLAANGGNTVGATAIESASVSSGNFRQMTTWFNTLMGDSFG